MIIKLNGDAWYGSHFICQGMNYCFKDQIHCDDKVPCVIECDGQNACQYALITCPEDASCAIHCHGGIDACKDIIVLAQDSSSLNITCDETQDEACDEQIIYCPDNGFGGPITTTISGLSLTNIKKTMQIFAVEGLNDVTITGSHLRNAQLYCKEDYSSACTMSGSFTQCNSYSNDRTCENYFIQSIITSTTTTTTTTASPTTPYPTTQRPTTISPTTISPSTISPTTQQPTSIPTISSRTTETTLYSTSTSSTTTTLSPVTGSPTTRQPSTALPSMRPTLRPISQYYDEERDPSTTTTSTTTTSIPTTPAAITETTSSNNGNAPPMTLRPTRAIPSNRPTRETQRMSLLTTTAMGAGFVYNANPGVQNIDGASDSDSSSSSSINPLYLVISILLTAICYISGALFCWVHYNHKYTKGIIALRRNSKNHSENHQLSPMAIGHHRIISLNDTKHRKSKSEMIPSEQGIDSDNVNNFSNLTRNRLRTSSLASFATAPTSMMSGGDNMGAPTTSHDTISSSSSSTSVSTTTDALSSATHSTNDYDDFKEIKYETNGHSFIYEENHDDDEEDELLETGTLAASIDKESVVKDNVSSNYGERDGPKETHNLQLSNLSDLKIHSIHHGKTKSINTNGNNYIYTWQQQNGGMSDDTTSEDDENLNDELEYKSNKSNYETKPVPNMEHDDDNENFPDTEAIYDLNKRQSQFDASSVPEAYKYSNDSINIGQSLSIPGIGYTGNNATLLQRIWSSYPASLNK